MAIADINEAGGVIGKDVTIVVKDDGGGTDDDLAETSVDKLINNEKVDAILGAALLRHHQGGHRPDHRLGHRRVLAVQHRQRPHHLGGQGPVLPYRAARQPAGAGPRQGRSAMTATRTWRSSPRTPTTAPASCEFLDPALTDNGAKVVESVTYDANATSFDTEVEQVVAVQARRRGPHRLPGGRRPGRWRDDQAGRRPDRRAAVRHRRHAGQRPLQADRRERSRRHRWCPWDRGVGCS